MQRTTIEWTDFSCNPIKLELPDGTRVNVCVKPSEGCRNCYAEALTRRWWPKRLGEFPGFKTALTKMGKIVLVKEELDKLIAINARIANGKADPRLNRVFWCDMTDLFGEFVPDEIIHTCFAVAMMTKHLHHQFLTKRAKRARDYVFDGYRPGAICDAAITHFKHYMGDAVQWPPLNIEIGFSAELQKRWDERWPYIAELGLKGWRTFCSGEPLLEPLELMTWFLTTRRPDGKPPLDLMIVGNESGGKCRPGHVEAISGVVAQCQHVGVPVFVKQLGSKPVVNDFEPEKWPITVKGKPIGDGLTRIMLKSKNGVDMEEWPEMLRIRQQPARPIFQKASQ